MRIENAVPPAHAVPPADPQPTADPGPTGTPPSPRPWAAVVLAGGGARRFGGRDKIAMTVGGRTLLDGVVAAARVAGAHPVVVVGPRRPTATAVAWTREDPPGGGPLAGLASGLAAVPPGVTEVAVLAGDLAAVGPGTLTRLRAAVAAHPDVDGAVLVDEQGRVQWLVGVWRTAALRCALPERPDGISVRSALGGLTRIDIPALPGETLDVDTPDDLRAARGANAG
ncbi:molybdenum cofactor guanylyltransferase [Streptoalloteichus hindustanus]|uniref:Molybdopterin-guanine dinucleotide biosynthesis protein A n=1 Tax=Streptoalloteichus hindustanus TaxID=2017 RepID=A0A1M5LQ14_STRHI|nr:NTP transferase domain-containing protein [Streptoalloteichus hindustanus]SHG67046.1 Molybdopterin-guanine dinucleotide biosynthesis protein A [Streptoalloteichus hindustanus]